MNIWILLIIVGFIVLITYLVKNKIVFRFDTLFRKGFKIQKDTYRGLLLYTVNNGSRKNT